MKALTIRLAEKRCTCTFVWDKKCTLWSFNNFVIFLDMADLSFTCTTGYKSCKNICNKSVLHNREYENWEYSRIHQPRSRLIIKYRDFWVEFEHENVYAFCFPFAQTYITLQLFEKKKIPLIKNSRGFSLPISVHRSWPIRWKNSRLGLIFLIVIDQ